MAKVSLVAIVERFMASLEEEVIGAKGFVCSCGGHSCNL